MTIIGGIVSAITALARMRRNRRPPSPQPSWTPRPAPVTPSPVPSVAVSPRTPTNMAWAIAAIVFCWPAAIPAIRYARRAGNAYAYGDVAAAHHAYTISRRWTIAATVYFAFVIIILIAAA
jgi:Interferon-induced transmembrane protein